MASPPFAPATTVPADNDIVSQYPAVERTFRDVVTSFIEVDHDATSGGHNKLTMIEQGSDPVFTGSQVGIWAKTDGSFRTVIGAGTQEEFGVFVGALVPTFRATAPGGYLFCYGQAVSRTTYSRLWIALGSPNTGDGSTTWTMPDLRGRTVFGKDDMGGSAASRLTTAGGGLDGVTLGAAGGAQSEVIAQANLPNVNFVNSGITIAAPTGTAPISSSGGTVSAGGTPVMFGTGTTPLTLGAPAVSAQGVSASGGSGTALPVVPPALVVNWVIKY